VLVIGLSAVSSRLWGGKPEEPPEAKELILKESMTVGQFAKANGLPPRMLKKVFGLKSPDDKLQQVSSFDMSADQVKAKVRQMLVLQAEHGSKNWIKIVVKFALWAAFLGFVFVLMRKGKVTAANRKWLLIAAVVIFGVILGSDPSPMGTIKDAVVLFGSERVIFPPRLIAFSVFLLTVILANKFICSWGCQLGTLQDAIFRLNRDQKDARGILKQYKVPFAISNSVRIIFFAGLTIAAFAWAMDIIHPIDPFKVFKPQHLGIVGAIFAAAILIASLFVYRPWCHFFCPFGLFGWVAEKFSVFKIHVDYDKCTACGACEKACPSTVMGAILKRDRVIPDCFSCVSCVEACPAKAISFKSGRRGRPPEGKFNVADGRENQQ